MEKNSKILYRIFKEDAEKYGMNMKEFYQKRRKGLYPFKDENGNVDWLSKSEFRIIAVKKRIHKKHSKRKSRNEGRKGPFLTKEMVNAFLLTASGLIILYFIVKLIQVLQIF